MNEANTWQPNATPWQAERDYHAAVVRMEQMKQASAKDSRLVDILFGTGNALMMLLNMIFVGVGLMSGNSIALLFILLMIGNLATAIRLFVRRS